MIIKSDVRDWDCLCVDCDPDELQEEFYFTDAEVVVIRAEQEALVIEQDRMASEWDAGR